MANVTGYWVSMSLSTPPAFRILHLRGRLYLGRWRGLVSAAACATGCKTFDLAVLAALVPACAGGGVVLVGGEGIQMYSLSPV